MKGGMIGLKCENKKTNEQLNPNIDYPSLKPNNERHVLGPSKIHGQVRLNMNKQN